jgi:photosystem II stability/assembly factor-like uncharacterized protein
MNVVNLPRWFVIAFSFGCLFAHEAMRAADCGLDTWTCRTSMLTPWLRDAAFGSGRFVAVGDQGLMLSSTDGGTSWQRQWQSASVYFARVTFANGQFFATGRKYGTQPDAWEGLLWSSADGLTWHPRYTETNTVVSGVAYAAGRFVAVAVNAPVSYTTLALTSPDGLQWTAANIPGIGWLYEVAAGNDVFVAVGGQRIMRSTDGLNWQPSVSPSSSSLQSVAYFNGQFISVGERGLILTSPSGEVWTERVSGTTNFLAAVEAGSGTVVVAGSNGAILSSLDGVNWTQRSAPGFDLRGLAFGADVFAAVGRYATVYQSGAVSTCGGPRLSIRPGLPHQIDLFGNVGVVYKIEYIDALGAPGGWQLLQQLPPLPVAPYTIIDPNLSPTGSRFYRAVSTP